MVSYEYYTGSYLGSSIPEGEFPALALRASGQLDRYKRIYTVAGSEDDESMAVCAMADTMYYFDGALNGDIGSVRVGSVSSTGPTVDVSAAAQARTLLSCASMYLEIFRGVR